MDSSGIHVVIEALNDARQNGWELELDPIVQAPVKRLLRLTGVDAVIWPTEGHPPAL